MQQAWFLRDFRATSVGKEVVAIGLNHRNAFTRDEASHASVTASTTRSHKQGGCDEADAQMLCVHAAGILGLRARDASITMLCSCSSSCLIHAFSF